MLRVKTMERRIASIDPRHTRSQVRLTHESLNTATAHATTLGLKLAMNARAPITPSVLMEDLSDALC